jgi:hypothetical protein
VPNVWDTLSDNIRTHSGRLLLNFTNRPKIRFDGTSAIPVATCLGNLPN